MKPLRKLTAVLILIAMISGIISAGFVSADDNQQQATFASPILVANTSFLNIRTGPAATFSVLLTVVGGTELPVLGIAEDGVWHYVATDVGAGWVNVEFTLPRGSFANVPIVDGPGQLVIAPASLGQGGAVLPASGAAAPVPVNVGGLTTITGYSSDGDFRAVPDLDAPKLAGIPGENKVIYPLLDVLENEDGRWFAIFVPELGRGWTQTGKLRYLECNPADVIAVLTREVVMDRARFGGEPLTLQAGEEGLVTGRDGNLTVTIRLQSGEEGKVPLDATASRAEDIVSVCDFAAAGLTQGAANLGQGGGTIPGTTVVAPVPATLTGNRVVVNTGNLNIRTGPGAQFGIVTTVPGGTELAVVGRAEDGVWYLTQGNYGQGWVNSQFTIFRGNYSSIPILADAYSAPLIVQNGATIAVPSSAGQGGGSLPVGTPLSAGTGVTPITGYSSDGDFRGAPSLDAPKLAGIPGENKVIYPLLDVLENEDGRWFAIFVPELGNGWTQTGKLRYLECTPADVIAVLTREVVMDRARFGGEPLTLQAGEEGLVTGRDGNLTVTIRLQSGEEGKVPLDATASRAEDIVSICDFTVPGAGAAAAPGTVVIPGAAAAVNQPGITGNRVVINTGNLNVRSGPAATFSIVATVPGGTELAVTGRANDGVWYRVQGNFGVGWVNNQFTVFRGNYASIPIVNAGAAG